MRGTKAKRIRRAIKAAAGITKMPTNDQRDYVGIPRKKIALPGGEITIRQIVNHPHRARALFQRWKRGTGIVPQLTAALEDME